MYPLNGKYEIEVNSKISHILHLLYLLKKNLKEFLEKMKILVLKK